MSRLEAPKRLLDAQSGAPDELRALLKAAEDDVPTQAQLSALGVSLGPLFGSSVGPATLAGHAAAGSAGAGTAKLVGVLLVAGALASGGTWLAYHHTRAPRTAPPSALAAPQRVATPSAPVTPVTPVTTAKAPEPAPQPAAAHAATPAPLRTAEPKAASTRPSSTHSNASQPLSEVQLLAKAQAALATHPERALALTREHQRRFPAGALVQEREVIAIQALSELGQRAAAERRAHTFEQHYPHSALERKVEAEVNGN